jgi:hypothetical protein
MRWLLCKVFGHLPLSWAPGKCDRCKRERFTVWSEHGDRYETWR